MNQLGFFFQTAPQPADAPRWPGTENASANRKWKVHTLARESKGEISPLRPVGPGTARGFWGRRQVHYSGESSEGNRFITAHDL